MKHIVILLGVLILCLVMFLCGKHSLKPIIETHKDTVTTVRIDTIIREKVIPKKVVVDRIIYDTLFSRDSVLVAVSVPISRYTFSDSLYRAEISGYRVSLDRLEIYNREVNKTIINTVIKRVPKRWGIGVSAGYSYTPVGFQPYIGIGVNYNVITF